MRFNQNIHKISFEQMVGNIIMTVNEESNCTEISCDKEQDLEIVEMGNKLILKGKTNEKETKNFSNGKHNIINLGSVNVVTNCNNMVIVNGKVVSGNGSVINGSNVPELKILVKVPKNMIKYLSFSCSNDLTLGSISDSIDIDTSGQLKAKVGNINRVSFDTSGQTNVIVNHSKNVLIDASGQGNYTIEGNLESLDVDMSGQGSVTVNGDVDMLNCDISGMSKVVINGKVLQKSIDKSGMCTISIRG